MASTVTMTGAEFDRIVSEDERRIELITGEVVEMPNASLLHQWIISTLFEALSATVRRQGGKCVTDYTIALGEDTRLAPDIVIFLRDRLPQAMADMRANRTYVPPDMAIEVVSPSERTVDSHRKIRLYLDGGVREVWQILPEQQSVFVYTGKSEIKVLERDQTLTTPLIPDWSLNLSELFDTTVTGR